MRVYISVLFIAYSKCCFRSMKLRRKESFWLFHCSGWEKKKTLNKGDHSSATFAHTIYNIQLDSMCTKNLPTELYFKVDQSTTRLSESLICLLLISFMSLNIILEEHVHVTNMHNIKIPSSHVPGTHHYTWNVMWANNLNLEFTKIFHTII
jgi:hypothetical protein